MKRRRSLKMDRLRQAATAAALTLLLSISPAYAAETAWDVLERFGLPGVWGADCAAPTTVTNFRYIYSRGSNGGAVRELDFGVGQIVTSVVESAELLSPSTLKIHVRNTDPRYAHLNNLVLETVLIKEINSKTGEMRIRFIEASDSAGQVLIKNGFVKNGANARVGKPTFWQYRCRTAMS
jgi:hypothetical protein